MFVVYLEAPDGEKPFDRPFKAFTSRPTAEIWASGQVEHEAERALIFDIPSCVNARAAIAAVQMGEGNLVATKGKKISGGELANEWRRAMAGNDRALSNCIRMIGRD